MSSDGLGQYTKDIEYRKNYMIRSAKTAAKELADMVSYLQDQDLDYRMFELAKIFGEIAEVAQYGKECMLQGAQAQSFESMFNIKEREIK